MKRPVHINIVGEKKSGKTTLIQSLISELKSHGISVGTVKHTSHDHEFDVKGTDSWKHQQAGSGATVIMSSSKLVCHISEPSKENISKLTETVFQNFDIILWEGNRNTENDIIECVTNLDDALFVDDDRVVAVVSEDKDIEYSNLFQFKEAESLARWLVDKYGLLNYMD